MKMNKTLFLAIIMLSLGSLMKAMNLKNELKRIKSIQNKQQKSEEAKAALNNLFDTPVTADQIKPARQINKIITEKSVRTQNTRTLNVLQKSLNTGAGTKGAQQMLIQANHLVNFYKNKSEQKQKKLDALNKKLKTATQHRTKIDKDFKELGNKALSATQNLENIDQFMTIARKNIREIENNTTEQENKNRANKANTAMNSISQFTSEAITKLKAKF